MSVYLDASAAVKLLVEEAESQALATWLDDLDAGVALVSCALLETELRRFAMRERLSQSSVSALLDGISLAEPDLATFRDAGLLPGHTLRSLDALHLTTALRADVSPVVAYDTRMLAVARDVGLPIVSPS